MRLKVLSLMAVILLAGCLLSAPAFASERAGQPQDADRLLESYGLGVTRDYGEAVKWYRKAAEQGVAEAQFNLGLMYDQGKGVTRDYGEAVKWYRKAAEQGNADAQTNLGFMYGQGKGVTRNYVEAYIWFSLATAQGDDDAKRDLNLTERFMTPDQIAEAQKRAAAWHSASSAAQ